MKYFTKEFQTLLQLENIHRSISVSRFAEEKNEEFYKKCYVRRWKSFLYSAKTCDWYIDPVEELHRIEQLIKEKNISDDERKFREMYKQAYIYSHKDRIENGKVYKFDEELCKRKFEERQKHLIDVYSHLPEEIKDKIADMRVFALGFASREVKSLLREFNRQLTLIILPTVGKACIETDEAENHLSKIVELNEIRDDAVLGFTRKGGDIHLECDSGTLIIKNARIMEKQCNQIIPYNGKIPNCPWTTILATELHRTEDKFELCFLMSNTDELEREELWYLTIECTDIQKIE